MKRKGFTLIEIIVCISLLAIIGLGSFVGIRIVNKNILHDKLEKITDKAIAAAEVYIETNKETYNQLYEKQNGVVIPLNVLKNEGLLDLSTTTLEDKDIEGEYVIAALSGGTSTENCVDIRTETSWYKGSSSPIYICTDSTGNYTKIATIDQTNLGNLNKVQREIYYFKGKYPNNYAYYNGQSMRILSVDTDDSITIVKSNCVDYGTNRWHFTSIFNNNMILNSNPNSELGYNNTIYKKCTNKTDETAISNGKYDSTCGGYPINNAQYYNTTSCGQRHDTASGTTYAGAYGYSYVVGIDENWISNNQERYIHLKPCVKITSGTGASDSPFRLDGSKC